MTIRVDWMSQKDLTLICFIPPKLAVYVITEISLDSENKVQIAHITKTRWDVGRVTSFGPTL